MCLSLEHQNPSKTSEKMGYFDRVDDRVTVSLHILYTANQETEGSQDRLTWSCWELASVVVDKLSMIDALNPGGGRDSAYETGWGCSSEILN